MMTTTQKQSDLKVSPTTSYSRPREFKSLSIVALDGRPLDALKIVSKAASSALSKHFWDFGLTPMVSAGWLSVELGLFLPVKIKKVIQLHLIQ